MALDLADFRTKAREAVQAFWGNRKAARQKQIEAGQVDRGERAGVTAGKNMDGFIALVKDLVVANGLPAESVHLKRRVVTLPGYFRPTKIWDLVVVHRTHLIAAIEFKSQVGPSFGNNFNNRTEEALGAAVDFWKTYREGGFGDSPAPFAGWLMLLEDAPESRSPVSIYTEHFPVFPEFEGASYADRYSTLCRKLMQEKLYTASCLMLSPRDAVDSGDFSEINELTSLRTFVTELAGHIAAEAAR